MLSGPLKQSLSRLAGQRRGTKQPEHEMTRLERMNANYEHDRAVLAKNDPLFAKNQFWDAGHAEGSGELSERDIEKISDSQSNDVIRKIKGMQI